MEFGFMCGFDDVVTRTISQGVGRGVSRLGRSNGMDRYN